MMPGTRVRIDGSSLRSGIVSAVLPKTSDKVDERFAVRSRKPNGANYTPSSRRMGRAKMAHQRSKRGLQTHPLVRSASG